LRVCGGEDFAEGLPAPLEGLEEPDLAGAGFGFVGCLAFVAGLPAGFPAGFPVDLLADLLAGFVAVLDNAGAGLALVCPSAEKLASNDATRTPVKAQTRTEFEKRMALG
jgi:hypothetical protein